MGDRRPIKLRGPKQSIFFEVGWRNNCLARVGNIDTESIIFSGENEFRTNTVNSIHKSGRSYPLGTSWIYSRGGFDAIQVTQDAEERFTLRDAGNCVRT